MGAIVFAAAAVTAGILRGRENAALEQASAGALHRAESAIRHRIADHVWGLSQLATSWEQAGGLAEPSWTRRALALRGQYGHIQAVEYVDPSLRVRRVVPLAGNEAALGVDLAAEPSIRLGLESSRDSRIAMATFPGDLPQGGRGFRVSLPLFAAGAFDGFLVTVYRIGPTLDAILRDAVPGFAVRIRHGGEPIYSSAAAIGDSPFVAQAPLRILNLRWNMEVAPAAEVSGVLRTWIPELVVLGGGLNAFFLALAIHLVRTGRWRAARLLAETDRAHDEMARRQRAEAAEREARQELQAVVASFPDHVWSAHVTRNGGFEPRYYSATIEKITGYPRAHFMRDPQRWIEQVHPEDRESVASGYRGLFSGEEAEWSLEYRILRADGEARTIRDRVSARPIPDGIRLDGIISDMTAEQERLRLEARFQQTQRLESLGVLAGGIAHDFNNLLVGILGHADLSRGTLPRDAVAQRHVGAIEKAARRAAELCRQMLSYAGQGSLTPEPLDLREAVEEMGELLAASASKRATIHYHFDDGLPLIVADASQIRQVAMNLITNAAEAMGDAGGRIEVTARAVELDRAQLEASAWGFDCEPGRYLALSVTDEGCGMDAETRRRMFEPFFTKKFAGRGLGLAAVLGIVRRHRGAIQVESEVGRGTTVTLLLPVSNAVPERLRATAGDSSDLRGEGTVLLVDDEPDAREVGSLMLERAGYQVLVANDGEAALEAFQAKREEIVCVVLDLTMPGIDGTETVRRLRALGSDVPVVLCSGYPEDEAISRFAGLGLAGFVVKPYSGEALLGSVRAARVGPLAPGARSASANP